MEMRTGSSLNDEQKVESLQKIQECCTFYGRDYIEENSKAVWELLAHGLQDNSPIIRKLSIETTSHVFSCVECNDDQLKIINKEIIPRLVTNLCLSNTAIKKSTVHTLHVYMKHFDCVQDVLRVIINQLDGGDTKSRTELMVALPIIITPAFAEEDIFELISALVRRLEVSSVKFEHSPPSMVCLQRIKAVLGESVFNVYVDRLPERLQNEYSKGLQKTIIADQDASVIERQSSLHSLVARTLSNGSFKPNGASVNGKATNQSIPTKNTTLTKSTSSLDKGGPKPVNSVERAGLVRARSTERVNKSKGHSDRFKQAGSVENVSNDNSQYFSRKTLYYGFVPAETMSELEDNNWKTRAHGIEELKLLIEGMRDVSILQSNLGEFLEMLTRFVEDPNFKVMLTSLYILRDVVDKVGGNIRPHNELILAVVQTKLGDSKAVIKQLNMQLVLRVMHFAKPWGILKALVPGINNRNSKVKEDIVNIVTAALLTFPSSDFNLNSLPGLIAPLLLDPKRKVRQAVLECFAVIAQGLGPGRMQPLVSSVDMIELSPEGEGAMEAVQARLARRKLPKITPEGTLEYSMIATNTMRYSSLNIPPDVSWILYGSSRLSGESNRAAVEGMAKRYFSAGKKRLPWESDDEVASGNARKYVGSAPIHSYEDRNKDQAPSVTRNSWEPGQNASYLEKYQLKGKLNTMSLKQQESPEVGKNDNSGSYFHMYKQRMRKLKQAGLQADHSMITTISRTAPVSASHSPNASLRRSSIGRDTVRTPVSGGRSPIPTYEDKPLSASWAGSDFSDNHHWHVGKKLTDLEPISTPIPESDTVRDLDSPVHLRPALARSASKKRRQHHEDVGPPKNDDVDESTAKKASTVDLLTGSRQPAQAPRTQKSVGNSFEHSSPFDSRPKIARSPSARKQKQKLLFFDGSKPSSDTSENEKDTPSPREGMDSAKVLEAGKEQSENVRKSLSNEHMVTEKVVASRGDFGQASLSFEENVKYADDFENENSDDSLDEGSGSSDNDKSNANDLASDSPPEKLHSGLSKSALARIKQRRVEEIRRRELSLIKQREKEIEERSKAEKEAKEAEERKRTEAEKRADEIKRIEGLIKAEEIKKQKEALEKKRIEEENEKRRIEELKARREQQAKIDETEIRRAEEAFRKKELNRREQRMKELEALIKEEEQKQNEMRRMNEEMKKEEEERERRRQEEIRKEEEHRVQIEEDKRKKAEAELKEAKRKKAELKRIKEQQLMQEIEAKEKEEAELREKQKLMEDHREAEENALRKTKYEAFSVNFGECERGNGKSDEASFDDANNNHVVPAASRSPRLKGRSRNGQEVRAYSGSHITSHVENSSGVRRSFTEGNIVSENLTPFDNPDQALRDALRQIGASSEDWETKCEGLQGFRRLSAHHPEFITQQLHAVCLAIVAEVRNLRSQVARTAIQCLGDIIAYLPKAIEPELDLTVSTLLSKSGESNTFIKEDVEHALSSVVNNVNSVKAMGAFINGGAGHRNAQVRKMCARFLAQIADKMGVARLLSGSKDITERILPVAAQFAVDGQQETRYYGRCILHLMIEHPDLDRLLEKHLPKANVRPAKDIVESLKSKGLRDAPNDHGSANLRRSQRNPGYGATSHSVARSSTFSGKRSQVDGRQGSGSKHSVRSSVSKGRQALHSEPYQPTKPLDMDSISGLDANEWKTRLEAIDNLYDLVRTNPEGVCKSISKVFDKFIPRLTDSNSKVNIYALQTMNKVIPILRDSLTPLITLLMEMLTSCVASKNNSIYNAAMEVLISLTKFVDNVSLLQPLIAAVKHGNTRVKPEMAMRLADLVTPVFQKKPHLVHSHILPVLWHLLTTTKVGSAANSRNDISTATAKLCEELYICYGESLYDEAETQGKELKEKLKYYMM